MANEQSEFVQSSFDTKKAETWTDFEDKNYKIPIIVTTLTFFQ